jgi:uncharacterized protein (TIGR02594 family)
MLHIYAPPPENDTEVYIKSVCKKTGFSSDSVIGQFSDGDLTKLMLAMEEHEGYHHKKETREETWVRTTTVGFSDGARPLVDLPVKVKRNNQEMLLKTNAYGQLSPFIHLEPDENLELWIKAPGNQWSQLDTLVLGNKSRACTFVNDFLTVRALAEPHNPSMHAHRNDAAIRYVVQPDDALSKIAAKFKIEAKKIQTDNGIKNANYIRPGQILMISKGRAPAAGATPPRDKHAAVERTAVLTRSKDGKGHPLAIIPTNQKRAPWMEIAVGEAKRWAGKKEDEITKESNYHKLLKTGLKTLVGNSNPWCASFVNWCLKQAGYPPTAAPASSQSFKRDKHYVLIDKPLYGAIAVFTDKKHPGRGHVGFLYALDEKGGPIILGGNQSDAINFESGFSMKLSGYYVPAAYLEFARNEFSQGATMLKSSAIELNKSFGIKTQKKTSNSTL